MIYDEWIIENIENILEKMKDTDMSSQEGKTLCENLKTLTSIELESEKFDHSKAVDVYNGDLEEQKIAHQKLVDKQTADEGKKEFLLKLATEAGLTILISLCAPLFAGTVATALETNGIRVNNPIRHMLESGKTFKI